VQQIDEKKTRSPGSGSGSGETWLLDRYQPLTPRIRVVVVVVIIVIMPPTRDIAALSSAGAAVGFT
jgi:hypothetical protein